MNTYKILVYCLVISLITMIIGAFFKITHYPNSTFLLAIGLISLVVLIITSIYEIVKSEKIDSTEKFMWIVGFVFFGMITGLVYILLGRKRIV